jgi:hypothetical protein
VYALENEICLFRQFWKNVLNRLYFDSDTQHETDIFAFILGGTLIKADVLALGLRNPPQLQLRRYHRCLIVVIKADVLALTHGQPFQRLRRPTANAHL